MKIDDEDALVGLLDRVDAPAEMREQTMKAARMGRETKRQHYVPAGYLEAWTDGDGHVGVWDTTEGRTFKTGPDNVCAATDFYTARLVDGTPTRLVEGFLAVLDERFISRVRQMVDSERIPAGIEERFWFAFDIALNQNRHPQRRRLMSALADRLSKTETSHKPIEAGIDPDRFEVVITEEFHVEKMFDLALNIAPILAKSEWTLHISNQPVVATCDVPVLFDYTRRLTAAQLSRSASGAYSLAQAKTAGMPLDRLNAGIATAPQIIVPLAPTALLEINPYGAEAGATTTQLSRTIRERHEHLIVRSRERMVVAEPGHRMVSGTRPAVGRRKQLLMECVTTEETEDGGRCSMRTSYTYAVEPEINLCGNHY